MSTFSIRLKELRKRNRETQEDISKIIGIQRTTFSGYERGILLPQYETLQILANHYHVSLDYLVGKSNSENYDIKGEDTIPDVYEQLMVISNELLSDTSVVKCKGRILSNDEKRAIELFVESAARYIDALVKEEK